MKTSTIVIKYPTYRDDIWRTGRKWIEGKRLDDNAEGLWRVHDKLYDLSDFANKHPGGKDWIKFTKGIDITEQFETHHLTDQPEKLLTKFYVRNATEPRNYKITFEENGFYKTVKRRVAQKLSSQINKSAISTSRFYCDLMLASTLFSFILVSRDINYVTMTMAAVCLIMLTVISHNFIHQRDNWRMYLVNFSMQNYREWRVHHAMSHHLYPNSLADIECTYFEPWFNWFPENKSTFQKILSFVMTPIVYGFIFPMVFFGRLIGSFKYKFLLQWDDFLPFTIPLLMYIFGNLSFIESFVTWFKVIVLSSILYGCIAVNAGHHHDKNFHDGDELKSMDFGIYQLAATIERTDALHNHFLALISFGQHVSHHLFPTLDHAILPQFNEIIYDTCREFEADLRIYPWYELVIGQFKQLTRTEPKKIHS